MSEAKPKNLTTKLVEVMAAIDHVEKRGFNANQSYKFMKATDVARAVREELATRNVLMLSDVVSASRYTIPTKSGTMGAVDLHVKYTFLDGDSDAKLEFHGYGSGADAGDKASPKAHTAALKYALRNTFLVPDESDPEADETTDTETQGTKVAPKPIQQQQTPKKGTSAPAKAVSGDILTCTVEAINKKPTKNGGEMWGFKTEHGWLNTFDPEIGNNVRKGQTVNFQIAEKNGYKNIVALVLDDPTMITADEAPDPDDCPF